MKRMEYADIGETCYTATLPNGLQIRVIPKPDFHRIYAFYAVHYGSIDTTFSVGGEKFRTPDGVAHYLEHKMFDMPYGDAMSRFADYGGNPNAFTSHTMTAYYFDCTERFEENLTTLLEFVSTPYFTQKSVEKERGIIAQEIRMYEDSAGSRVYDDLFRAMYEHHPIRVPIAGTVDSIQEITADTLTQCHAAFYAPSNALLCVMGNVDADRVAEIAEKVLPKKNVPIAAHDYGAAESMRAPRRRTSRKMEVSMPTFVAGFKAEPAAFGVETMKAEFLGDLAADLLTGISSPMYQKLYEQGLIDASFSAGYESVTGAAMFSVSGDSRDPEAVTNAVMREAERAAKSGFDEAYFARMMKATLGRKLRDLDSFESTCYRMCEYAFSGVDYFSFRNVLQSITNEDVRLFLENCIREERCTLSVITPKGEK